MTRYILILCAISGLFIQAADEEKKWIEPALPDKATLSATGKNVWWPLEPGLQYTLEKKGGTLVVTVTSETKQVDGVETRVIEERESEDGKLIEVSRNYFAISKETSDVYYFGEDVDMYKDGKIVNHEGSWLAGVNGAKAGLFMPGKPVVGLRFYQEQAPKVAMDRAEIVGINEELSTPGGKFSNCVRMTDSSAIEKGTETKIYAPNVGLAKSDEFELVKVGKVERK